nr:MAG TPA: hypothetical protein [Caudoviricetes sp.]
MDMLDMPTKKRILRAATQIRIQDNIFLLHC